MIRTKWDSRFESAELVIAVIVFFTFILGAIYIIRSTQEYYNPKFTLGEIGDYLNAPIPSHATDLDYDSLSYWGLYIHLSFKASPESVTQFAQHICGGVLHSGYNPFDAVDSSQPFPNAIFVRARDFVYYSHSFNTPDTIWGNRCQGENGFTHRILVNKTNPTFHTVKFELPNDCNTAQPPLPCTTLGYNYVFPVPESYFPIAVVGIVSKTNQFVLAAAEFCIETLPGYYLTQRNEWANFYDAEVHIAVDGQPMPPAYIAKPIGALTPRYDAQGNMYTRKNTDTTLFQYCLNQPWQKGVHTVQMAITTRAGKSYIYSWQFSVVDNPFQPSDQIH